VFDGVRVCVEVAVLVAVQVTVPVAELVGVAVGVTENDAVGLAVGDALGVPVNVGVLLGVVVGNTGRPEQPAAQVSMLLYPSVVQPMHRATQSLPLMLSTQKPEPHAAPEHAQQEA